MKAARARTSFESSSSVIMVSASPPAIASQTRTVPSSEQLATYAVPFTTKAVTERTLPEWPLRTRGAPPRAARVKTLTVPSSAPIAMNGSASAMTKPVSPVMLAVSECPRSTCSASPPLVGSHRRTVPDPDRDPLASVGAPTASTAASPKNVGGTSSLSLNSHSPQDIERPRLGSRTPAAAALGSHKRICWKAQLASRAGPLESTKVVTFRTWVTWPRSTARAAPLATGFHRRIVPSVPQLATRASPLESTKAVTSLTLPVWPLSTRGASPTATRVQMRTVLSPPQLTTRTSPFTTKVVTLLTLDE
mmetsp:Transcript_24678/g.97920  ORF Transcript_24678/g.97920 Transcript_24678/m.97920 type:complete len:306 (-) Transcript_24678:2122-3039(-)